MQKWVEVVETITVVKLSQTWINGLHFQWVSHATKGAHLQIPVTLAKKAPLKRRLFCKKWIKLAKLGQSCKNYKMGLIWRNGSHLQKWVTLKNWVAFGEMGHT